MPAGGLDDDPGVRPMAHIFVASKAPWYPLPDDGLPRFDELPPGAWIPQPPSIDLERAARRAIDARGFGAAQRPRSSCDRVAWLLAIFSPGNGAADAHRAFRIEESRVSGRNQEQEPE